jgi:flagellin-like protein
MKGVSEVIAIILILMIVIALAALAYTWFSGVFASLTGTAGTAVTNTVNQMNTQFRIESTKGPASGTWVSVSIRNLGTQNINGSSSTTAFYVDGNLVTAGFISMSCTGCSGTCSGATGIACTILPAAVANYNLTTSPSTVTCGTSIIKVTNGAALDSRSISC